MQTLTAALSGFQSFCLYQKNLSAKTMKAYGTDLRQFHAFLNSFGFKGTIGEASKIEIKAWLESLSGLKPKSVKRKIATVKALFNYLEYEDEIAINPMRKMRIHIKEPKNLPQVLSVAEVKKILHAAYRRLQAARSGTVHSQFECVRNVVVLELLFATGARVSEIACLTLDCIDIRTGLLVVKGKGDRERMLQVCNAEALAILQQYYHLAKPLINASSRRLLINRLGRPLTDQSIRLIVKRAVAAAAVQKRVTPHTFRHSFATLLLEKDVDIRYIQSLLGHSSVTTTQLYTHINRKKQRRILLTKHPRGEMVMGGG